jgi:amino acid transporter
MSAASEDLRQLWQRQALDAPRINLTYLKHRTENLQRRTRIRNSLEYIGGIAGMTWCIWFGWSFISPRPLMSIGIVLWVLAVFYGMFQWHRRAGLQVPAEQLGTLDALQFYRQQLVRQRDARRGSWRRWLPPLTPCLIVILIAFIVEVQPTPWRPILCLVAMWAVLLTVGALSYEKVGRRYQQEIDALDSMDAKS